MKQAILVRQLDIHRPVAMAVINVPTVKPVGDINYSNSTQEQIEAARAFKEKTDNGKIHSDIMRRVSAKQARCISEIINGALTKAFNGVIPPDDEIDEFLTEWRKTNTR